MTEATQPFHARLVWRISWPTWTRWRTEETAKGSLTGRAGPEVRQVIPAVVSAGRPVLERCPAADALQAETRAAIRYLDKRK